MNAADIEAADNENGVDYVETTTNGNDGAAATLVATKTTKSWVTSMCYHVDFVYPKNFP